MSDIKKEYEQRIVKELKEKEVLKVLFQRYLDLLKERVFPVKIQTLPEKCQKQHLIKLLSEATENIHQYPHDKLNRWLGFSRSIVDVMQLDTRNRPTSYIVAYDTTKSVLEEAFLFEKAVIEKYSDERFENNHWPLSINKDNVFHLIDSIINDDIIDIYPNEVLQQYLGYIQGVLCIAEIINVDEERVYKTSFAFISYRKTKKFLKVKNENNYR